MIRLRQDEKMYCYFMNDPASALEITPNLDLCLRDLFAFILLGLHLLRVKGVGATMIIL